MPRVRSPTAWKEVERTFGLLVHVQRSLAVGAARVRVALVTEMHSQG
jgi:hypothetical protein